MIERDPAYNQLAAQLALNTLYKDALSNQDVSIADDNFLEEYQSVFKKNIERGVEVGNYDPRLLDFDLDKVSKSIVPERDQLLKYFGVATLTDRYFVKDRENGHFFRSPTTLLDESFSWTCYC